MGLEGKPGEARDRLHAVIVPNFDVLRQRKVVNAKEVIRFDIEGLSQQIASTKRIGSYEIWQDDLPRTTTRKIKRFEVEKRVRANQGKKLSDDSDLPSEKPLTPEESEWLDQPDVQRALNIIRETASAAPPALRPTLNLELDLGLDSMQRVEVLSRLEEELGGNVEESQLAEIYTVRDLVDAVLKSSASGTRRAARQLLPDGNPSSPKTRTTRKFSRSPSRAHSIDLFWYFVSRLIQVVALDRFDLKVSGIEKLPQDGAYILSSNHQSYLDPLILASILPPDVFRRTFAVGTSEIFGKGFMRKLARSLKSRSARPGREPHPRHARRGIRLETWHGTRSLSGRRTLDRRHTTNLQEGRSHSLDSHAGADRANRHRGLLRRLAKKSRLQRIQAAQNDHRRSDPAPAGIGRVRDRLRKTYGAGERNESWRCGKAFEKNRLRPPIISRS